MIHMKGSRAQVYRCAVPGCCWATEPKVFVCLTHWRKVPSDMKAAVQAAAQSLGDTTPAREALMRHEPYVEAADSVLAFLSEIEGRGAPRSFGRPAMSQAAA